MAAFVISLGLENATLRRSSDLSPLDFASPVVIFAAVAFKQALGETIEAILSVSFKRVLTET